MIYILPFLLFESIWVVRNYINEKILLYKVQSMQVESQVNLLIRIECLF